MRLDGKTALITGGASGLGAATAGMMMSAGTRCVIADLKTSPDHGDRACYVRTDVTDAGGNFRFTLLPPGNYSLTATLSGFNTVKQQNIAVGLNRTVTLDVALSSAVTETTAGKRLPSLRIYVSS